MGKFKKIAVILIVIFVIILIFAFVAGSLINFLVPPSQALYSDAVIEDIGADSMLTATLKGCVKTGEENIPDGSFKTSLGQNLFWKDAKNISYVDVSGKHGYMIVWKTSPEGYDSISSNNGISFISDYLDSDDDNCFLVHFPEKNTVYGVILGSDEISYSEYQVLYNILGLSKSEYPSTYHVSSSSSDYSSGGSDHYHTVLDGRYSMSRNDPGSYYDHYEYGDNYDIDNYLESEGFD